MTQNNGSRHRTDHILRRCGYCFEALPEGGGYNLKYHPECHRLARNERSRENRKRCKYLKKHPGRKRDLMKTLGADYVALKLEREP